MRTRGFSRCKNCLHLSSGPKQTPENAVYLPLDSAFRKNRRLEFTDRIIALSRMQKGACQLGFRSVGANHDAHAQLTQTESSIHWDVHRLDRL